MAENSYMAALGYPGGENRRNLPFVDWMLSKVPAAAGGLTANMVYEVVTTRWFVTLASQYGAELIGSLGLGIVAYIVDHSFFFRSNDLSKAFTDGLIGRGAPVLSRSIIGVVNMLIDTVKSGGKAETGQKAQAILTDPTMRGLLPQTSLDNAPQAAAEMISLLADSPRTRELIAQDLVSIMEKRGMEVTAAARADVANCINDLAAQYKR